MYRKLASSAGGRTDCIEDGECIWLGDTVIKVKPVAPRFNQPGIFQGHQLLGDVRLPQIQHRLDVTDALLAIAQNIQDCQTCGMGDGSEKVALRFVFVHVVPIFKILNVV